jgi:phage terminase small subunit
VTKDRYIVPAGDRKKRGRPPKTMEQRAANKLTRRQELFVKELVSKDGQVTMKEAAINAGYPEKSASSRAYELTNPKLSPHVCRAIQEYRRELDSKYGIDYQRHVRDLQRIRDMALSDKAYSAAVMAEYRRGQAQGDIYVSKSEVRHGTIESMSKEEVMKALKEIKEQYEPVTYSVGGQSEEDDEKTHGKKQESAFWKSFRNQAKKHRPNWLLTRIESWAAAGVPDVLGCDDLGQFFMIELKTTQGNSVRLSPHQVSFLTTHQHAPAWVLVHQSHRNGESIFLYAGKDAAALVKDGLRTEPVLRLDMPFEWIEIFPLLTTQ